MALTYFPDGVVGIPLTQVTTPKVMVNGDTLVTVTGGPIVIEHLFSLCVTANDATASTLQYSFTPTIGSATTISGASTTLASVAAGTVVTVDGTILSTVPLIGTTGVSLTTKPGGIIVPAGALKIVVGVGSTTGTWQHYLHYTPLVPTVTLS